MESEVNAMELTLVDRTTVATTENTRIRAPANPRKFIINSIIAIGVLLISAAIAAYLFVRIGLHEHLKIAAVIFEIWFVVSGALAYVLAIVVLSVYCNMPKRIAEPGTETVDVEQGVPLQDLSHVSRPTANDHRHSNSSGSPLSIPAFNVRGRMAGQDYRAKRKGKKQAAPVNDGLEITPVSTSTIVPKSPFDNHPNPLASSPVMAGPPPNFPSAAVLRNQASAHSGFSAYSHASRSTTNTKHDPFNDPAFQIQSASSISLTSIHGREVSMTRKHSITKIRDATKRRAGVYL
ncbi:hypothetical protein LTR36_000662 [Oleoguttula mirabilis]|uniref:Uncharacterized protein n=1 Tax=Oleoguttula mirabilis TaxID=1507867 RepID=A0AAV9JQR7_9PEZI|nr:hypothetical protein LTR36_000662 [Oleoguttula mirabilis]